MIIIFKYPLEFTWVKDKTQVNCIPSVLLFNLVQEIQCVLIPIEINYIELFPDWD